MNAETEIAHDRSLAEHPFVARLSHLMTLGAADLRSLELIIESERQIKKRKDLVVAGDEYHNLCFVKNGYAIRYKLLRSGKRQILNVILPGDVIGFPVSFFDRSIYSVVAVSDLTYNVCSLDAYAPLCYEQPQFGLALSWLAAYEAAIYAEHIVDLGRRTPIERMAHFLTGASCPLAGGGASRKSGLRSAVLARDHGPRPRAQRAASQPRDAAIARGATHHQPRTFGRIDRHAGLAEAGALPAAWPGADPIAASKGLASRAQSARLSCERRQHLKVDTICRLD